MLATETEASDKSQTRTTTEMVRHLEKTVYKAEPGDLNFVAFKALKTEITEQANALKLRFEAQSRKIAAIDRILKEFDYDVIHWSNLERDFKKLRER